MTCDARALRPGNDFVIDGVSRTVIRTRQTRQTVEGLEFHFTEIMHGRIGQPGGVAYATYPHGVRVVVNEPMI